MHATIRCSHPPSIEPQMFPPLNNAVQTVYCIYIIRELTVKAAKLKTQLLLSAIVLPLLFFKFKRVLTSKMSLAQLLCWLLVTCANRAIEKLQTRVSTTGS